MITKMTEKSLPQFCCDFVTNNCLEDNCFQTKSHLKQNHLKWLLEKNDNYCNHWTNNQSIDLFSLKIVSKDFDSNQMKIIFTFVKKTLNELRTDSMTRNGNNESDINDYGLLRDNLTTFLALLRRRLFEICIQLKPNVTQNESKNTFCISVIKQMKGLLLFVGRLSQIRPQLIRLAINSDSKTSIYNYFHSCLDIWWTAIEMMYILDQNCEINLNDLALIKDQICGQQLCSQSIRLVLFDLIVFSVNRFNEMKESNKYESLSLFDCLCVKEMYVLVRHMFGATNKSVMKESFFELMFSTLNLLTNSDSRNWYPIKDFKTIAFGSHPLEDTSLHFVWFVTNIVQTLNYDISGHFSQSLAIHSIPTPLLRRITQVLRQSDSDLDKKLLAVILFCLNGIQFWKPNTDILLPFTEYFLKNLNKNYFKTNVEELAIIPKTSGKWYQIVREISNNRNNSFMENSFYLFLSLMSEQLSSVFSNCDSKTKLNNWHKFKGKFVVNLHSNRLKSCDETTVFNLLSFYLVLINTNHEIWSDFIDIIIETNIKLIETISNRNILEMILKFLFTVLHIKPKSLSEDKISPFLGKTFRDFCEQSIENSILTKHISNLIIIYFDELKTLIESNHLLDSSFDKLLNIDLIAISSIHSTPDQQLFVIHFISDLLKAINQNMESHQFSPNLIPIINICFDSYFPFIKQLITQKNEEQILPEIAFNLTKIANNGFKTNHQKLSTIFNDFIEISGNNRQFLCNYLNIILQQNSEIIRNLNKDSDISSTLISIWCRFLVSPDVNQSSTDELTYRLSLIIDDMRSDLTSVSTNSCDTFFILVKNLTEKVSDCDPNSRMSAIQRANKYFGDMIITSEEVLKSNFSLNSFKKIHCFVSSLLSIGSQLLYIPTTTNCLLPKIIETIVIPNLSNQTKAKFSPVLEKAFPLFIEGLFKLQSFGNEYIERQIRRIISFYLPLYVKHKNAFNYLKNQLEERNIYNIWIKHLFATIVNNFFNRHESCSISEIIPFVEEFCKSDLNEEQLIEVFNRGILKLPLTDHKSRKSLLSLLSGITDIFANLKKERLLFDNKVFLEFIETNLLDNTFVRISEVINTICKTCPHLFHDFIGQITRTLETIEKKRSIGIDNGLRNALREFANQKLPSI